MLNKTRTTLEHEFQINKVVFIFYTHLGRKKAFRHEFQINEAVFILLIFRQIK